MSENSENIAWKTNQNKSTSVDELLTIWISKYQLISKNASIMRRQFFRHLSRLSYCRSRVVFRRAIHCYFLLIFACKHHNSLKGFEEFTFTYRLFILCYLLFIWFVENNSSTIIIEPLNKNLNNLWAKIHFGLLHYYLKD